MTTVENGGVSGAHGDAGNVSSLVTPFFTQLSTQYIINNIRVF